MRIRIPGLVDIVTANDRETIAMAASEPALDRAFVASGPLVNRLLVNRVCHALTLDGQRLPSIVPRGDRARQEAQEALQRRLDALGDDIADDETLRALTDAVRNGADEASIAIPVQQVVGRWFVSGYKADVQSWLAAQELHAAVSSRNIPYALYLRFSGRLRAAQRTLSDRADGDRTAIHATGIAVHNIVRGFVTMRKFWRTESVRRRLSDEAVLSRCLFAPESVLRQAVTAGETAIGEVRPGTLVVMSLEAARARDPGFDISFLSKTWSHCPAGTAVVRLFHTVWSRLRADAAHG